MTYCKTTNISGKQKRLYALAEQKEQAQYRRSIARNLCKKNSETILINRLPN